MEIGNRKLKSLKCGESKWGFRAGYALNYYCTCCLYILNETEIRRQEIDLL